jgi:hypothetical protein
MGFGEIGVGVWLPFEEVVWCARESDAKFFDDFKTKMREAKSCNVVS